jgi:hypothetical protein
MHNKTMNLRQNMRNRRLKSRRRTQKIFLFAKKNNNINHTNFSDTFTPTKFRMVTVPNTDETLVGASEDFDCLDDGG